MDLLFKAIVLPENLFTAFQFTLLAFQTLPLSKTFKKCHKSRYTSVNYKLLFYELKYCDHLLHSLHPWYKDSSERFRNITGMGLKY